MVWKYHGVDLDVVQIVTGVAQNAGKLGFPDFCQLFQSEAGWPATVLVPEPISQPEVVELFANDAGESGSDHGSGQGSLGDSGAPQINVVRT